MSNVRIRNRRSEPGCAQAMRVIAADIKAGVNSLEDRPYLAVEVAERYRVHPRPSIAACELVIPCFPRRRQRERAPGRGSAFRGQRSRRAISAV